jgi:teichuronic acid exporter
VSGIINQVAFPAFASGQSDIGKVASHFLKAIRVMSFIAFPVLWGISSVAPEIVNIMLGESWSLAIIPLQTLSLVMPIRMISSLVGPMLLGLGRADVQFSYVLFTAMTVPVGILIGSFWGLFGASVAWVVVFPPVFAWNMSRVLAVLGIKLTDVVSAMAKPTFSAFAMYLAVVVIRTAFSSEIWPVLNLVLLIIAGVMVYGGMVLTVDRQTCREILDLLRA